MKSSFFDFLLFPAPDGEKAAGLLSGKENARVLVILGEASDEIQAELEGFLNKVLEATRPGLSREVLLLWLTKGVPYSFSQLARQYSLQSVLIFGARPQDLGLHFHLSPYQPVQAGSTAFLLAHPLSDIYAERQRGEKGKAGLLWKALQVLFPKS